VNPTPDEGSWVIASRVARMKCNGIRVILIWHEWVSGLLPAGFRHAPSRFRELTGTKT